MTGVPLPALEPLIGRLAEVGRFRRFVASPGLTSGLLAQLSVERYFASVVVRRPPTRRIDVAPLYPVL